jgi:NADH:ubiquinone oxidoreductase subunit 3 (subunit A)
MTMFAIVLFVPILAVILLLVNALLATLRPDTEKMTTYECGYDAIRGQTRTPFTISFYLVAVLFLAFDLEVACVIPLAPSLSIVGTYGFWVSVVFFLVLTLGFVVEVASGVLSFTDQRSAIHKVAPLTNNSVSRLS